MLNPPVPNATIPSELASSVGSSVDFSSRPLASLGDALNRFVPPPGFNLGGGEGVERKVRYGFRAVGFCFLIQEGVASEVVPSMPCTSIPNTPDWLMGMMNLHGNLVPICSLARVSGIPSLHNSSQTAPSTEPMILVLGKGDTAAGFVIDGYPQAVVNPRAINHVPNISQWLSRATAHTFISGDEVWLEFDYQIFLERASQG